MRLSDPSRLTGILETSLVIGAVAGLVLVFYGYRLIPGASLLSIVGAAAVFFLYGLLDIVFFPAVNRMNHLIIHLACVFGLLGGAIFTGEMLLEYLLLPTNNSLYGLVEFGYVFIFYFLAGLATAYQSNQVKQGVLAAVGSAVISSLIWGVAALLIFYLFQGSIRQAQVFRAEGNYAAFVQSGMQDFNAWVLEDFLEAIFFHLTLVGPLAGAVLGAIGGLFGKSISRGSKVKVNQTLIQI
jgi:hypothetical protein